jgi:hypothetical protein
MKRSKFMNLYKKLVLAVLVTGMATLSAVQAQEKKLKREDLPPAVEKTVAEQSKGAAIQGFSTEMEDGKRLYEVELVVSGHAKDISMDKDGNIVEVEEEIPLESLSSPVKDGLTQAAGSGTISKVESITKNGKLVAYEAQVKTGTKRSEVQVGPEGKKLAHPE